MFLTSGRVMPHYQSGTQTRRTSQLDALMPEPLAEMHPTTAGLAIVAWDKVPVVTRRGAATFTLKVTATIREDTVFVPFHWGGEQSANRLTSAALDPVSRMPEFKVCAARVASLNGELA